VFLTALSLTLAALSAAVPVSSLSSGAAVAVCFSPEENCAAFADRAISNAEREILVGAYGLTNGSSIVEALIRAKERGRGAAANSENLNLISSAAVAAAYAAHWRQRLAVSIRFDRKEDWCRVATTEAR